MSSLAKFPIAASSRCAASARIAPGVFCVRDDAGGYRIAEPEELIKGAMRIIFDRMMAGPQLTDPRSTREYLKLKLAGLEHEVFGMVYLDNRNRVIAVEELFRGTIDGASVYSREVVKAVLQRNAAAVILFHNHPSGVAEPSQADQLITQRLKDALRCIDVRVLDHLVIAGAHVESMAERGQC